MSYDARFFQSMGTCARRSAGELVPLVLELATPRSVIDVGCGTGSWLTVFRELGVRDIYGVDGDWVKTEQLEIPAGCFRSADLSRPLRMDRQFDLVVSLEVAEHLPADSAETFVESLCALGSLILFSAAIPFQGGKHHVNEQWPDYWAGRFADRGFIAIDCLRSRIWENPRVDWFYAQNVLLYAHQDRLTPALKRQREQHPRALPLVHPEKYLEAMARAGEMAALAGAINRVIPAGSTFILVDQEQFRSVMTAGAKVIPFLERDGVYWGNPLDDQVAIREVERLRGEARFIVFARPAFWWLDHYVELRRHLYERYRCVLGCEHAVAFDLS